jgi:hypothetical protein
MVIVTFLFVNTDNYVHRIVQNKSDGKLVEVARQEGMVSQVPLPPPPQTSPYELAFPTFYMGSPLGLYPPA